MDYSSLQNMTWLFSFKKSLKLASVQHSSFETLIMWTTTGLVGLVLMLLVSVETKSSQEQSLQTDRIEFNNTEKLQEVNFSSVHIIFEFRHTHTNILFQLLKFSNEEIITSKISINNFHCCCEYVLI